MKLKRFLKRLFNKRNRKKPVFSAAVTEGIIDLFKEMGYKINNNP